MYPRVRNQTAPSPLPPGTAKTLLVTLNSQLGIRGLPVLILNSGGKDVSPQSPGSPPLYQLPPGMVTDRARLQGFVSMITLPLAKT